MTAHIRRYLVLFVVMVAVLAGCDWRSYMGPGANGFTVDNTDSTITAQCLHADEAMDRPFRRMGVRATDCGERDRVLGFVGRLGARGEPAGNVVVAAVPRNIDAAGGPELSPGDDGRREHGNVSTGRDNRVLEDGRLRRRW